MVHPQRVVLPVSHLYRRYSLNQLESADHKANREADEQRAVNT